ncbi:M16 family metallopeptidase [Desulfogranum mediterraneum]|uniref:M16 family metallopeptidase n=1 Tax=Desulfogranum mediterraneum TaxID=160661 RepID=UPI00041E8C80|nr:M16 family metallopeptidase [Desulfogranum mediterraneum]
MNDQSRSIIPAVGGFALLFFVGLLLAGCGSLFPEKSGTQHRLDNRAWPHELSDLPPDPAIHFGRLDNGLRYLLLSNKEPQNRVGLYLNVQAGSLQESDQERGLAHYLEHMLFNGTSHYPPGTLVEYFQSIGMGFGADTNAHTGFAETVYKLVLPSADPGMLDEGLLVLADYARGALLLEEEVERERGIILAEKRARDSVAARVRKQQLQFEFAGTRVAKRDPIGSEEVLLEADSARLRGYYDRWYRPERLMVVVVGDMDPAQVEPLLISRFSPIQAAAPGAVDPPLGTLEEEGSTVLYLHEPELGATRVALGTVFNQTPQPDTSSWERQQLSNYVATSILANRLDKLVRRADSPLVSSQAHAGTFLQRLGYARLSAVVKGERWQEGLALLDQTLGQALESGFTPAELERVKRELQAYLEKQLQTAATRNSMELAATMIRKLNNQEVLLSPQQEEALYAPMLEAMTLAEANQALVGLWQGERRLLEVIGAVDLEQGELSARQQILAAVEQQTGREMVDWKQREEVAFPYLPPAEQPAQVVAQENYPAIKMERYLFQDGTRLHVKQTDFQENQIQLAVHFGQGLRSEPLAGMAAFAEGLLRESGLGRLNREQLEETLAGTNVQLQFQVGRESFVLAGSGLSEELELLLQLVQTQLLEPVFREKAYLRTRTRLLQMYDQLENSVEGQQQLVGEGFFTSNHPLYTMADRQQVMAIELDEIKAWLQPILATAPLEISIVGDMAPEKARELVARYFGAGQRAAAPAADIQQVSFPAGARRLERVKSEIDKALVTVAWQTDDFWDISKTRRLNLLAAVLGERLRLKVREELGATYSPVVYNRSSRVSKGFGILRSQLSVAPDQALALAGIVQEVAGSLARELLSEEELDRSLEPTLTSIRDFQRSNSYWLNAVLALSSRHPRQLQWPLTILSDFAAITPEEIQRLAGRYLQSGQAAVLVVSSAQE